MRTYNTNTDIYYNNINPTAMQERPTEEMRGLLSAIDDGQQHTRDEPIVTAAADMRQDSCGSDLSEACCGCSEQSNVCGAFVQARHRQAGSAVVTNMEGANACSGGVARSSRAGSEMPDACKKQPRHGASCVHVWEEALMTGDTRGYSRHLRHHSRHVHFR
jgi:hypothetical protein